MRTLMHHMHLMALRWIPNDEFFDCQINMHLSDYHLTTISKLNAWPNDTYPSI